MSRLFVSTPVAAACGLFLAASTALSTPAFAADDASLAQLRQQIDEMRQQYESRLRDLEKRLGDAEQQARQAREAQAAASSTASAAPQPDAYANNAPSAPATGAGGGFNPSVAVILSGTYANLKRDPDTWKLNGFASGDGEIGPGQKGFNLGESEITLAANIDPWWYGALTASFNAENEVSVEEAFIQTTALSNGVKLKAGRFFSGIGYLNEQHAHTWDFVDAPLAYQAFLGGQLGQDGVQAKWLLPTDQFIELGAELGRGANYPGTDTGRNGAGASAVFAHIGGDVGDSNSWRAGLSHLWAKASDRAWDDDMVGAGSFTGSSRLWVVDGVWKWAPNGNGKVTNFKLQGEYFRRAEKGDAVYGLDPDDSSVTGTSAAYRSAQSGWYLQGVYQFMPTWRVGLRYDQLDTGSVKFDGVNLAPDYNPRRTSVMLDWSLSEFSRWRLQLNDDRTRDGQSDPQIYLQYQMSLGAHGAHSY